MRRTKQLITQSFIAGIVFGFAFTFICFKLYSVKQSIDLKKQTEQARADFIALTKAENIKDEFVLSGGLFDKTPIAGVFKDYNEYVNVCKNYNVTPRSITWYYEKFPEQKPKPILGQTIPDGAGGEWILYYHTANIPIEHCNVVNGNTFEILDEYGNHEIYIMLDIYTSPFKDRLTTLHLNNELKNSDKKYKFIEFEIDHTFPNGDRMASKARLMSDIDGVGNSTDLINLLFEKKLAAKTEDEAMGIKEHSKEQLEKFEQEKPKHGKKETE